MYVYIYKYIINFVFLCVSSSPGLFWGEGGNSFSGQQVWEEVVNKVHFFLFCFVFCIIIIIIFIYTKLYIIDFLLNINLILFCYCYGLFTSYFEVINIIAQPKYYGISNNNNKHILFNNLYSQVFCFVCVSV